MHGESLWTLARAAAERGERVPVPIAVAIVIDTLHGLRAAHQACSDQGEPLGIVHRDVSPQNILVGAEGVTRIVDFGIAEAVGRPHLTRDSSVKASTRTWPPSRRTARTSAACPICSPRPSCSGSC